MVKNPEAAGRGRIGGFTLAAKHDPKQYTAAARAAFQERFLDEVDPERTLPEPERARRAKAARSAWYARLALRSAQARALRKQAAARRTTPTQAQLAVLKRNTTAAVSDQSAAVFEEGQASDRNLAE